MANNDNGAIYILTNPSFPDLVKIGYADDVEKRVKELNRSECTPYAFRIYATYKTNQRLTDLKLHKMIDKLNPNLRTKDNINGKKRVREFYALSKEDAYSIFEAIAEINGLQDNLKIWDEKESRCGCDGGEKEAPMHVKEHKPEVQSKPNFTEDYHFDGQPENIVDLYQTLKEKVMSVFGLSVEPKKCYISFKAGNNIVFDVVLLKSKVQIFLDLRKGQLEDRNNLTRDVSNVGHWGNGDYETSLKPGSNMDKVMDLIKQTYELKK